MAQLNKVSEMVMRILIDYPAARDNDDVLYFKVIEEINPKILNYSVGYFFGNRRITSAPPFETVRRSRQKIQELHPYLGSSKRVEEARQEEEKEYRAFAKSKLGESNGREKDVCKNNNR